MKIFIVGLSSYDYECSYSDPIKAFVDYNVAEIFIDKLKKKSDEFDDKWKEIQKEREEEIAPLMKLLREKKLGDAKMKEFSELNMKFRDKEQHLIDSTEEYDALIKDKEHEEYSIEEIELDESILREEDIV